MDEQTDRTVLPIRRPPFSGFANQILAGSQPDWGLIDQVHPPQGAPNVLLVLIDAGSVTAARSAARSAHRITTGWSLRSTGSTSPR
jgi:hypothetical protein